jgi:hypothetical protein
VSQTGGVLFVIYVLCVHRLSRLITTDMITEPLRERLRRRAYRTVPVGKDSATVIVQSPVLAWLHDLVSCGWCSSIWVAIGCAAGWKYQPGQWFNLFAAAMAASSGTGMLQERVA